MGKSLRIKLAVVLVAVLAAAVWIFSQVLWPKDEKKPAPLKILPQKVDLEAKDILYTEVGSSDVKYEIRAKTVKYQKKDNTAEFETVNVKLILPEGRIYTITSDRGVYNTEKKDIAMTGNVVVKSDIGDRITTEKLYYKDAKREIRTDSAVTMVNKDIEVKGVGLTLSIDEKHLTLHSHVKAKLASNRRRGK